MSKLERRKKNLHFMTVACQIIVLASIVYAFVLAGQSDTGNITSTNFLRCAVYNITVMLISFGGLYYFENETEKVKARIARRERFLNQKTLSRMSTVDLLGSFFDHWDFEKATYRTGRVLGIEKVQNGDVGGAIASWAKKNGLAHICSGDGTWITDNGVNWTEVEAVENIHGNMTLYERQIID